MNRQGTWYHDKPTEEIHKQINIIELAKNEDYMKIIYLFYDE